MYGGVTQYICDPEIYIIWRVWSGKTGHGSGTRLWNTYVICGSRACLVGLPDP